MTKQLVLTHLTLAKRMARQKNRCIPHISYDELESAAYFGLVDAAVKYNSEKNDNFSNYASVRIAGAMSDYLRELQWGSRANPVKMQCLELSN
jgi:DNA-directed RNA polymerase specialized sigma subunit